jgi:uncharacterized protein (DUF488 family)
MINRANIPEEQWPPVWTIGHSTRPIDAFLALLISNAITNLVDVRSYPGSRRFPQYNKATLSTTLATAGIDYHHLVQLGGRRRPLPHSRNIAWQNLSFRAYADYMDSADFRKGIEDLLDFAREKKTAIMCAEALWWRCHRGLIADHLKASGSVVTHIIDSTHTEIHPYTAAAKIISGELSYCGLLPE